MSEARREVFAAEAAFAQTMKDRDLQAFASFVADEAIFYSGATPLHGKAAVVKAWTGFYSGAAAPFSWEPKDVEVLASGTLAISSGPVRDTSGAVVATFTSVWRREPDRQWRVVFDKGNRACNCAAGAAAPP